MPTIIQIAWNYSKIILYEREKKKRRINCDNCSTCSRKSIPRRTRSQFLRWQAVCYTLLLLTTLSIPGTSIREYHGNFGVLQSRELRIIHSLIRGCGPKCREGGGGLEGWKVTLKRDRKNKDFNFATGSPSLNLLTAARKFSVSIQP